MSNFAESNFCDLFHSNVVLEAWSWPRSASKSNFYGLGLGLRTDGLGLKGPGLDLGLGTDGLGLRTNGLGFGTDGLGLKV